MIHNHQLRLECTGAGRRKNRSQKAIAEMREPNFFIIGAQKSGTTYLAKCLADHPDVFFSNPKEPLFFSRPGIDGAKYEDYLRTYFSDTGDQSWIGEGSTTYLQWPHALENIKAYVSGIPKIIVCMRQPTEKAVSFYIHNWRRGRYAPGTRISDALDLEIALSPVKTSLYAPGLRKWLDAYPREAFCFLKFDQLREDPRGFVCAASDFLGIPEPEAVIRKQVNAGFGLVWKDDVLVIDDPNAPIEYRPEFTRSELERLHALLLDDIEQTEQLTGLDLGNWRSFPSFED